MDKTDQLQGTVQRIIYHNAANEYSVFALQTDQQNQITVQGVIPGLRVGQLITVTGAWKHHPKFGTQFHAQQYISHAPKSIVGLTKYLSSGLIKGIGPTYATRLVQFFGEEVLEIIEKSPEKLARVPGIGKKRCDAIIAGWQEQRDIAHIMIFLQEAGITPTIATKIYKKYGSQTIDIVKANPYRLAQEVWGIGFRLADQLAKNLGFAHEGNERITAGIFFALSTAASNGHLYCRLNDLIEQTSTLLESTHESCHVDIKNALEKLLLVEKVKHIEYEGHSYLSLSSHVNSEKGCASFLLNILHHPQSSSPLDTDAIYRQLRLPQKHNVSLHEEQQKAILSALLHKVSIITGGPGTGKTTVITTLIAILEAHQLSYALGAPTGRAAKRMMQATGKQAMTIHRLLEFDPAIMQFTRNEQNALPAHYIIIDETSMIDIFLAHALLKAVSLTAHIIFIGDTDQLPSVGPGNFLRDMLESNQIPHTRLTHIFRQAEDSLIILNAHRINKGEFPLLKLPNSRRDFLFIKEDNPENIPEHLRRIYQNYLPTCGIVAEDSIVLSPMKRGTVGTQKLNIDLQHILNSTSSASLFVAGVSYKIGDRVIQTRNNYEKFVFNGDIGIITAIDGEHRIMTVLFFERNVEYKSDEVDELMLAYAISIHKSQGSEYELVIVLLFMQHFPLLARNLIYTALTRAKKQCIFIGQIKALAVAIGNNTSKQRVTFLQQFLQKNI